ncbi:MAG: class I SAM-dependent methyltransferase, partial [Acetobacteraceae bacterium]
MPDLTLDAPRADADADALADLIEALWTPKLDPLFWRPARVGIDSAWTAHVPFAHWLVATARPRLIVELGTHNGVSYSAFCEAVLREKLEARCYAVDTWQGDAHAGFYGEEVLGTLRRFHDARYAGFSELLRCTFDEALPYFADNSIDLLHIDGCHAYEQVRADFENWAPKLSRRAVVLFHDTNVRERGFGVWRLWAELAARYPGFEFLHGYGLGVLAFGAAQCPEVAALAALSGAHANAMRERCALLGERWVAELRERSIEHEVGRRQAALDAAEAEKAGIRQALLDARAAHQSAAADA